MPTFERSILVHADVPALFDLMQDYDRRLAWDPFLREARLVDAAAAGIGIRAWCVDQRGRGMETEYVSFDRPHRVAVRMTRGPWIFRKFAGAWIYDPVEAGVTRVTFKYHVEARLRLGRLGDAVLTRVFAREMDARLQALARAVQADPTLVSPDRAPPPAGSRP